MRLHNPYNRSADVIEIILKDASGRKMERLAANSMDKISQTKIGTKLFKKYDIDLTPDKEQIQKEEKQWVNSDNSLI